MPGAAGTRPVEFAVDVGDLAIDAGSGEAPAAGGQGVDGGAPVQAGVGGEVAAEAAVGAVERHTKPVVLDPGNQPAAEQRQQDQGEDAEAELAGGRDPNKPVLR